MLPIPSPSYERVVAHISDLLRDEPDAKALGYRAGRSHAAAIEAAQDGARRMIAEELLPALVGGEWEPIDISATTYRLQLQMGDLGMALDHVHWYRRYFSRAACDHIAVALPYADVVDREELPVGVRTELRAGSLGQIGVLRVGGDWDFWAPAAAAFW